MVPSAAVVEDDGDEDSHARAATGRDQARDATSVSQHQRAYHRAHGENDRHADSPDVVHGTVMVARWLACQARRSALLDTRVRGKPLLPVVVTRLRRRRLVRIIWLG